MDPLRHVDPSAKELMYNPKAEELFAPTLGPEYPFKSQQQMAHRNTLAGYVEDAHLSEFQFETQRKTFTSFGYALDPSVDAVKTEATGGYVGNVESAETSNGLTVYESSGKPRPPAKRKLEKNDDSADVEGYRGPWAPFENESRSANPSDADRAELDEYLAKMQKRNKPRWEEKAIEEKTTLHSTFSSSSLFNNEDNLFAKVSLQIF